MRRRSRWVALLVAAMTVPAVVGVAAPPASAAKCTKVLVVGVRGSGEQPGFGRTVSLAVDKFRKTFGSETGSEKQVEKVALDYPATEVSSVGTVINPLRFFASARQGIDKLERLLDKRATECPDQGFVLVGFSQGALVVNRALVRLGEQKSNVLKRVVAVGLIADPQRIGTSAYARGTASSAFNGLTVAFRTYPADNLPNVETRYGRTLRQSTESYCLAGDVVCAWNRPRDVTGAVLSAAGWAVHLQYRRNGTANRVGKDLARLVVRKARSK